MKLSLRSITKISFPFFRFGSGSKLKPRFAGIEQDDPEWDPYKSLPPKPEEKEEGTETEEAPKKVTLYFGPGIVRREGGEEILGI